MYNVLLVDDEPIVKIALRTMIAWEALGFPICGTASDGAEALALIEKLHPDIIITDLKMPNMDGLQLIRELNNLNYPGKVIVASNFGDYELVREALLLGAVDYMLKISIKTDDLIAQLHKTAKLLEEQQQTLQEQDMRQIMQNSLKSVKNSILKDYFHDTDYELEHFVQDKQIKLNMTDTPCYLFYITFDLDKSAGHNEKSDISLAFIENTILDLIDDASDVELFQVGMGGIAAMISRKQLEKNQGDPVSFINKIRKLIQMYISVEPLIVYSREIKGYVEARKAYWACKDALNVNFYEHSSVIYEQDIRFVQELEHANYVDYSNSLLRHWQELGRGTIPAMLEDFIGLCKQSGIHPTAVKAFMLKCLEYIPLCEDKVRIEHEEEYECHKKELLQCKDTASLLNTAALAFEHLSLVNDASDAPALKKVVLDVMDYVEAHYQDKITLEMISTYVNFSENYLCRVFKEQVGMSPISYINTVKMNKAAALIAGGHTYMKEVAALVGISDQFYFNRLFKKQFGVSPSKYTGQNKQAR